jgi:hypothetical protein
VQGHRGVQRCQSAEGTAGKKATTAADDGDKQMERNRHVIRESEMDSIPILPHTVDADVTPMGSVNQRLSLSCSDPSRG